MPRILAIDDEPIYHKMIEHALKPLGYEVDFALEGMQGLNAASAIEPDVIITDVMMPGMNGYEVVRRLRKNPRFMYLPVLVLTSKAELGDKLAAFESGADDYMSKPFEPEELTARLGVLLKRAEINRAFLDHEKTKVSEAQTIAIHSLRGGVGASSMAVNLAIGLWEIWQKPTLLLDTVLTAGQVALMLNAPLKRTWADLWNIAPADLDQTVLNTIIGQHKHGLNFITGPTLPSEAEMITPDLLRSALNLLRGTNDYIVVDLPHDFSDIAINMLDTANTVLMMMAPEMASIRAAAVALDTYRKLGYDENKIKLVLNNVFEQGGLNRKKIEEALHMPISLEIPYATVDFVRAVNVGKPILYSSSNTAITGLFENLAFNLSKEEHKSIPPAQPTVAWRNVYKRLSEREN